MKILIDNCHGVDTKGKRSPVGRLLEYAENRLLAGRIVSTLKAQGLGAELLVPEENDISLPERCRVNQWCRQLGRQNVILISIHCNAAGRGDRWYDARGWCCAYTTRGNTRADALATALYQSAKLHLPGHRLRTDYTDGDPDQEKDFYLLRHTMAPAVLVENLFMDNHADCDFLLNSEGQQTLIDLHVDGICAYSSLL